MRNKRLVHFYKWEKPALCGSSSMMAKIQMEPTETNHIQVTMGASGPMLAVVLSLAAMGALLVGLAIVLQRRYNSRYRIRNRRF